MFVRNERVRGEVLGKRLAPGVPAAYVCVCACVRDLHILYFAYIRII